MTELPLFISRYLDGQVKKRFSRLCILVNHDGGVVSYMGEPGEFGLEQLVIQQPLPAPLLDCWTSLTEGCDDEVIELPFLNIDAEHIVHCHLLRQGGQCCVLLIDANREHAITQDLHQQANQISVL
ncbi:MAG: hypothetical protein GY732_14880, partial [Gammaproteobacteria bacterium]|nr:hypothetical protein [Gammaproteobacteria bacterium]